MTQWHLMVTQNVPKKFLIKPTEANTPCTSKRRIRRAHRVAGEPGALWRLQGRKAFDDWGWLESQPWKVWLWGWVYGIQFTTLYTLNRAVTTALVGFNMFQPEKWQKYPVFILLLPLSFTLHLLEVSGLVHWKVGAPTFGCRSIQQEGSFLLATVRFLPKVGI